MVEITMNPRSQKMLQASLEAYQRSPERDQKIYDLFLPHQKDKWIQDVLVIIKKMKAISIAELEINPRADDYIHASIDVMKQMKELDACLKKWEQAIENNRGKGITAFLDEAEPLAPEIIEARVTLEKIRREQVANNAHVHPALEPHYALKKQLLELGALIKKLPVTKVEAYQPVVMYFNEIYKKSLGYTNYHIDTLEKTRNGVGVLDIDGLINQRREKIKEMFAAFDKLAEMEEAEDNEQQSALDQFAVGAKAIRSDGQEYLDGVSAIEVAALKQEVSAAAVEAPVLNFAGNGSPPSSGGHTPPSDSELSSGAASAADEMQAGKFTSSSSDVSPERSPKKGALDDEKEMPVASLVGVAESYAPQPSVAAPAKKGLLSKLFSSKKPSPPVLPPKSVVNGNGQKQENKAPAFK